MKQALKSIAVLLVSLSLAAMPLAAESDTATIVIGMEEFLGANNYVLATGTEKGDAYANEYGRTYNPMTEQWGTYVGNTADGTPLIELDTWTIRDVLGDGYYLLTSTPEKGNCYANAYGTTYTPATNEYGSLVGLSEGNVPIIQVIGTIYPTVTTYVTTTFGSLTGSNPDADAQVITITPEDAPTGSTGSTSSTSISFTTGTGEDGAVRSSSPDTVPSDGRTVYIAAGTADHTNGYANEDGNSVYHLNANCRSLSRSTPVPISEAEARAMGMEVCKNCDR